MVAILVFANWGRPDEQAGFWYVMYSAKWLLTVFSSLCFALILIGWFGLCWKRLLFVASSTAALALLFPHEPLIPFGCAVIGLSYVLSRDQGELGEWFSASWGFAKQITPLLLGGVLVSGLLLGRPGNEGLIPNAWVANLVGGNSLWANFFASVVGAFMYFATLTEVPIVQGLLGSGMGKGPAIALLLAGPALSLPSMLVLNSIMGTKKTVVYCLLVVTMATVTGVIFGTFF
jgi:hypothetical protein